MLVKKSDESGVVKLSFIDNDKTYSSREEFCKEKGLNEGYLAHLMQGYTDIDACITRCASWNAKMEFLVPRDHKGNEFLSILEMCEFWNVSLNDFLLRYNVGYILEVCLTGNNVSKGLKYGYIFDCFENLHKDLNSVERLWGIPSKVTKGWIQRGVLDEGALVRSSSLYNKFTDIPPANIKSRNRCVFRWFRFVAPDGSCFPTLRKLSFYLGLTTTQLQESMTGGIFSKLYKYIYKGVVLDSGDKVIETESSSIYSEDELYNLNDKEFSHLDYDNINNIDEMYCDEASTWTYESSIGVISLSALVKTIVSTTVDTLLQGYNISADAALRAKLKRQLSSKFKVDTPKDKDFVILTNDLGVAIDSETVDSATQTALEDELQSTLPLRQGMLFDDATFAELTEEQKRWLGLLRRLIRDKTFEQPCVDHKGGLHRSVYAMCSSWGISPLIFNARLNDGFALFEALSIIPEEQTTFVDPLGYRYNCSYSKMCNLFNKTLKRDEDGNYILSSFYDNAFKLGKLSKDWNSACATYDFDRPFYSLSEVSELLNIPEYKLFSDAYRI